MHQPPQQEPENLKDGKAPESTSKPPHAYAAQIQYQQHHQQHLQHLQQQIHGLAQPSVPRALEALDLPFPRKRKLHAIEEKEECSRLESAYDADVDDDVPVASGSFFGAANVELTAAKLLKIQNEREHIYELFQPWALKTYGDQAKTKTITLRKKARILKALEGKEHSRPDSSKFRFWVKSKGFTTKRPEGFQEAPSSQRRSKPLPPNAILSEHPSDVDLFVASTSKDFGKRIYRKVAVVEEFFDIIYNVHMELGGRSGMHAGQKRTYRIITETYGFLPREAVTRFLSTCPECKKNLRPSSPAASSVTEDPANESSSEVEVLNYSSHTESSLEAGPMPKTSATAITKPPSSQPQPAASIRKRRHSDSDNTNKTRLAGVFESTVELSQAAAPVEPKTSSPTETLQSSTEMLLQQQLSVSAVPKLRINPQLQRPTTPPLALPEPELVSGQSAPPYSYHPLCFDMKARENLVRYYEFMRRFYAGGFGSPAVSPQMSSQLPVLTPPIYGSDILQGLRFPTSSLVQTLASTSSSTPLTKMEDARPEDDSKQKTKKFKTSPDSRKVGVAQTPAIAVDTPATPKQSVQFKPSKDSPFQYELQDQPLSQLPSSSLSQSPQLSAINLTKQLLFRSNGTPSSSISASATLPTTSTPTTSVKLELSTSPPTSLSKLRIPQVRAGLPSQQPLTVATATSSLPPLDLERLKPITSTYLQLTRSMGLSDEDALRFDNLFASSRSVSHTQTTLKSNGDKVTQTWTESDDADDHPLGPFPVLLPPDSEPTDFTSIANTDTLRNIKPYKETIRIGASSLDELRKQAAVAKGMDPAAVSELLATKQPVIKTMTDEKGQVRTTTYKLEPDGGISSRTIIELRPELPGYIHPVVSGLNLEGLPAWSTQSQPEPKWPQISSQNWPELEAVPSSPTTDVQLPESWNPNLWGTQQKPYFKPTYHTNPDVEVFAPRKSTPFDEPIPFPDENTDPFGSFGSHPPGTYTKTTTDDNGNTIKTTLTVNKNTFEYPIDRPFAKEFPTKHWFESPSAPTTRKPITNWPSSLSTTTVRTIIAKKPDIFNLTEPEKPSLEDFLKSQYGHIPRERPPTPTQPTKPKIGTAYVPLSPFMPSKPSNPSTATSQNPIATINVDDLPVAEVLRNGKPVQDEDYFGTLPSEMRPTLLSPTKVYNIKNIPQTPTLEDFDPVIRERLVSAGITNEDLRRMQGDEITKTTVDPDGKITRTTIKVRLAPQTVEPLFQPKLPYPAVHQPDDTGKGLSPADTSNTPDYIPNYGEAEFPEIPPYELPVDSWKPKNPIKTEPKIDQGFTWPTPNPTACSPKKDDVPKNPVDAFLHKLDLKAADLFSNHGEWLKTIVDENGRVLTVKLTLSDIVDESKIKQEKATPRPLK